MSFNQRIRQLGWASRLRSCPLRPYGLTVSLLAAVAAWVPASAGAAKPHAPEPAVRIPLNDLGFPGYTLALMHAGASMATVHVLDSSHLLFTYSLRSLVPRLPGDSEKDQDRLVAAEIVAIPTGKILARTEWHLHDHGRYLWSAGRGVYVLRSADELSVFTPLRGLAQGTAFERIALPHRPGHPVAVDSSPDGKILTVQVQQPQTEADLEAGDEQPRQKHTLVHFYRLDLPEDGAAPLRIRSAGLVGSPGALALALDGDGYLWADDVSRSGWKVSFNEYAGKAANLADVHSTCAPRMHLLSRSEFAVVSCPGVTDDARMLSSFGFDGHENWEEPFGAGLQPPTFVAAPEAGRFAISRLEAGDGQTAVGSLGLDDTLLNQQLRVYGTESGDLLLSLPCLPAIRSAENFDLSADGRTLVVLSPKTLDVYRLPELTAKDRQDLAEVKTMVPPEGAGPVLLSRITRRLDANDQASGGAAPASSPRRLLTAAGEAVTPPAARPTGEDASGAATAPQPAQETTPPAASSPAAASVAGDAPAGQGVDAPRKPPTLLEPGESPEFKPPAAEPQ